MSGLRQPKNLPNTVELAYVIVKLLDWKTGPPQNSLVPSSIGAETR